MVTPSSNLLVTVGGSLAALYATYSLFWWYEGEKCEKPKYTVKKVLVTKSNNFPRLRQYNEMEVREYSPYIVASVTVDGVAMSQAMSEGFKKVARYIFGDNKKQNSAEAEKVAMTSPVQMAMPPDKASEKMSMTAPVQTTVDREGSDSGKGPYTVSFVMPSSYTQETLPVPNDKGIKLKSVPGHTVAALTFFGGSPSPDKVERLAKKLRAEVEAAGLKVEGDSCFLYQYHPPFAPNFLRRVEVLYRVSGV